MDWTEAAIAELREMTRKGVSTAHIARHFGCTDYEVRAKRSSFHLKRGSTASALPPKACALPPGARTLPPLVSELARLPHAPGAPGTWWLDGDVPTWVPYGAVRENDGDD